MGQAAGIKRRKRRAGGYNLLKNRKSQMRKDQQLHKAGLRILGLDEGDGKQCLLTRVSQGGLVPNLNKFQKPDPLLLVKYRNKKNKAQTIEEDSESEMVKTVEELRKEAKERKYKKSKISIPGPQVKLLSYYLDRYGEDFRAMTRDPMNYDQHTWKQLRDKISSFKKSLQFTEYLKDRGCLSTVEEPEQPTSATLDVFQANNDEDIQQENNCENKLTDEEGKQVDPKKKIQNLKRKIRAKNYSDAKKKSIVKLKRKCGL